MQTLTPPSSDEAMASEASNNEAVNDDDVPADPFLGWSEQELADFRDAEDRWLGIHVNSDDDTFE